VLHENGLLLKKPVALPLARPQLRSEEGSASVAFNAKNDRSGPFGLTTEVSDDSVLLGTGVTGGGRLGLEAEPGYLEDT